MYSSIQIHSADEFESTGMPVAIFKHIPNLQDTLGNKFVITSERQPDIQPRTP